MALSLDRPSLIFRRRLVERKQRGRRFPGGVRNTFDVRAVLLQGYVAADSDRGLFAVIFAVFY